MISHKTVRRPNGIILAVVASVAMALISPSLAFAQVAEAEKSQEERGPMHGMAGMEQMPMKGEMVCTCSSPMMGAMQGPLGVVAFVLGGLLVVSVVSVLGALTVFLLRRSEPRVRPEPG